MSPLKHTLRISFLVFSKKLPLEGPTWLIRLMRRFFHKQIDYALAESAEDWNESKARISLYLGANPECVSLLGDSIPLLSRVARSGNASILELLLLKGADPEARQPVGTFRPLHQAAIKGKEECCRLLIQYGADYTARAGTGWSALVCACRESHAETIQTLLECGASPEDEDEQGYSALSLCAERGCSAGVQHLLHFGANCERVLPLGWRALHVAASCGHIESAQILLQAGAQLTVTGPYGRTPIGCARAETFYDCAAFLERALLEDAASQQPAPNPRKKSRSL